MDTVARLLLRNGPVAPHTWRGQTLVDHRVDAPWRRSGGGYPRHRLGALAIGPLDAPPAITAMDVALSHGRNVHKLDHPAVGRIALACDTLIVAADDLRIMIYTAEPETEDAERLSLAIVLGTQSFSE